MATSRGATPANPTLVATTDDAARGGLFARSNAGNPVSGLDVQGVTINDSTITIDINGTPRTFTTNQAADSTLSFTVEGGGGGTGNPVVSGSLSSDNNTLRLVLEDSSSVSIDVSNLNTSAITPRTDLEIQNLAQGVVDNDSSIVRTVNNNPPVNGNVVVTSTIDLTAFESSDSVIFRAGTSDANDISADAAPTWTGNALNGSVSGNVQVSRLSVDSTTGFILQEDTANPGHYILRTPLPGPAQGNAGVALMVPAPENVFMAPTPPSATVNADPGSTITMVSGSITNEDMSVNVPAMVSIDAAMDMASVTFPMSTTDGGMGDYGDVGEYTVTTMTTVVTPETMDNPRTITMTDTFTRFIPYYTLRATAAPTTFAQLEAGTISMTGYTNSAGFTAPGGTGNIYFATTELTSTTINTASGAFNYRLRVRHEGSTTTTDAGGATLTYNIYRISGAQAGDPVTNLRTE